MPEPRCWINTVSQDHVDLGVEGGFTQADHGRPTRLRWMSAGDRIAFYSPRTAMGSGPRLQQLTALGTVVGDGPVEVEARPGVHVWRLEVDFEEVTPADIRPLLPQLSFITDPDHWGLPFRRGLFEIPPADMDVIAVALRST